MVPLGAFAVAIVAIVGGYMSQANRQRLRAEQRLAMVARGMSADDIEKLLDRGVDNDKSSNDPVQNLAKGRTAGLACLFTGVGLALFGLALAWIVQNHETLAVAAVGLIPGSIGVGLLIDYSLHKRDLTRYGLQAGQEK